MLDCARVTCWGRGDEVEVRSGGDRARVDSGGLLWYGAKLWVMIALIVQAVSVTIGGGRDFGETSRVVVKDV
jgi:hypothetical protein